MHGNVTLDDAAVVSWRASPLGSPLDANGLEAIKKRLQDSGRFDTVEVRKRYRTMAMDEIALVLSCTSGPVSRRTASRRASARRLRGQMSSSPSSATTTATA